MGLPIGQAKILWGDENPEEILDIGSLADFTYDDDLKEDNVCQLVFNKCPVEVADRTEVQQGQKISVSWGRGQSLGDPVVMVIEEPGAIYGSGISLILRCHDKGTETKGVTRHKVWPESMKLSEAAAEIADNWGFVPDIEAYDGAYDRVQSRESDFRYLQRQAEKIGFRFWIDIDTLNFKKDATGAPSILFVYRSGNLLKNFSPRTSRQQKKGSQTKTTAEGFDLKIRAVIKGEATAQSDSDTQLSGGYVTLDFNSGNLTETIGRRVLTPHHKQTDVDRAAHGARKADARGQQEATMEVPGLAQLRAGVFIQIEGVAQTYAGLWRIKRSTHRIGSNGYGCQLVLDRETTGTRLEGAAVGEGIIPEQVRNNQDATTRDDQIFDLNTGQQVFQ